MLGVGDFGSFDKLVLNDHRIPGVTPENALPLTHPTPAPKTPAHKAAEQERDDCSHSPAAKLPREEVKHCWLPRVSLKRTTD